ncbi:MAG: hypothetical protein AABY07_08905, partial [Nanoarchaeota archaeon]
MVNKREAVKKSKKILIIVVILLIIIGIGLYYFNINKTQSESNEEAGELGTLRSARITCSDTDGGRNYEVQGTTTRGSVSRTDSCLGRRELIKEYYCRNRRITSYNYDCTRLSGICREGACISQTGNQRGVYVIEDEARNTLGRLDTLQESSRVNLSIGELDFVLTGSGKEGTARLFLKDVRGRAINDPALTIIEERDDNNEYNALINVIERGSTIDNGIGIDEFLSGDTWSKGSNNWRYSRTSISRIIDSADKWGTIVTYNTSDADQYKATISYPTNQIYSLIYVSGGNERVPLFTEGTKLYVNDSLNKVRYVLTRYEMPVLLESGIFSGNVDSNFVQAILIGKYPRITFEKQPTSSDDPNYGLKLGRFSDYQYNLTISFSRAVNFTHQDSEGESIRLFGNDYIVDADTDADTLILLKGAEKVTLENGNAVMIGEDDTVIDGTIVAFEGLLNNLRKLTISVSAPNNDEDAIMPGES